MSMSITGRRATELPHERARKSFDHLCKIFDHLCKRKHTDWNETQGDAVGVKRGKEILAWKREFQNG
jgi:hypothetical protein